MSASPVIKETAKFENSFIKFNDVTRQHHDYIKKTFGITALEMQLIQYAVINGPQKMKSVSEHFCIKLSTFTSTIDKAEKQKILKRVNSKKDRRVVFLDTTKKGKTLYEKYAASLNDLAGEVQNNLSKTEFTKFLEGLELFNSLSLSKNAV